MTWLKKHSAPAKKVLHFPWLEKNKNNIWGSDKNFSFRKQNSGASKLQNFKIPQNLPALNNKKIIPKTAHIICSSAHSKNTGPSEKLLFWISPVGYLLQQVLKHVLLKREPYVGVQNGGIYLKWETGVPWNLLACWCLQGRSILMFLF